MELGNQEIVEELDRIRSSDEFSSKPIMKKLLSYLVGEYLEGRSHQIKACTIGVDVFGRGTDFDPNEGAVVRNNAVRLRRLLKTYYLGEGRANPIVIDIPKGRYVPQFSRNSPRDNGHDLPDQAHESGGYGSSSIGVLPLRNLSGDPELDFLGTGFSQALSDALTRFDDLRVIGMDRRGQSDAHPEQINASGIDFLVAGEFQITGEEIKVSCRLLETAGSSQLWGDNFRFSMNQNNLFDLQEAISDRIACLVGGEYGRINQVRYRQLLDSRPHSLAEQDVLLKHYHHVTVLTDESMADFYRTILLALEQNPGSALINAIAGGFYGNIWAFAGPDADAALGEFARLTERAYTLNPNHQLVLVNLAFKCFAFDEKDRLFSLYEQSAEGLPASPILLGGWATYICLLGEWERGKALLDRVFQNNLYVPSWLHGVACMYHYRLHDYETALVEANKIAIPDLFWGPTYRTVALAQLGRFREAEQEFEALLECRPDFQKQGRRLIGVYIKESDLLEHVLDGFARIGRKIA